MVPSIHSKTKRILTSFALLACLAVCPSLTWAEEEKPAASPEQMAQAKEHYTRALDHHGHKEYPAAAKEYEKAFEQFPNPEFIFNAAQVYRLDGQVRIALEKYKYYLELDQNGRGAGDARAHIASLKIQLGQMEEQERKEKEEADQRRAERERRAEEERKEKLRRRLAEERRAELAARALRDPGSKGMRIAGLTTAGLGLVSLAVGGKFGLDAKSHEQDVTGNTVWSQQDFEDGQDAERNALLFFGLGGAAVVTGGVLYWLGRSSTRSSSTESQISVTPTPTKSGASLLVHGKF
jgi:tetratricopeptide (TPR) repeat protein